MKKQDVVNLIRANLQSLPLSFQYLGALQEQEKSSNFNDGIHYKPATVNALQSNVEPVGVFYKPIVRVVPSPLVTQTFHDGADLSSSSDIPPLATNSSYLRQDMVFRLFACAIPVMGAARAIVCDVQRQHFHFIPNALYHILVNQKEMTFQQLLLYYGAENEEVLSEYFSFLLQQEYGFWCDASDLGRFPDLSLHWDHPLPITNAILDYGTQSNYDLLAVLDQLDDLGCAAVCLRFFTPQCPQRIEQILDHLLTSRIKSLDILLPFETQTCHSDQATLWSKKYNRISNLILYGAPSDQVLEPLDNKLTRIILSTASVSDETHCGLVHPHYFMVNIELFTESQHFNNCLNRKISVDQYGLIKNCPALPLSYGQIVETNLREVVCQPKFREVWSLTKDQIEVCRDCEFRYICTDCRANQASGLRAKPVHCKYDPYTATWLD